MRYNLLTETTTPQSTTPVMQSDPRGIVSDSNPIPSNRSSNTWTIMVLIFVIVILSMSTAYLFVTRVPQKTTLPQKVEQPTPTHGTVTPSFTQVPEKSKQTYISTYANYQISYPDDWTAKSVEPGPPAFDLSPSSRGILLYPSTYNSPLEAKTYITVETDGPQNQAFPSYDDWLFDRTAKNTFFTVDDKSPSTFAGVAATTLSGNYDGYGYPAEITIIFFKSPDSKTYFSLTVTREKNTVHQSAIDEILMSFEFSKQ